MMRRIGFLLIAMALSVSVPVSAFDAAGADSQAESAAEEVQAVDFTDDISAEDVKDILGDLDVKDIETAVSDLYGIVTSEKFQRLSKYPEVRELGKATVELLADYVYKKKEVTEKILASFGMQDKHIAAIRFLIDHTEAFPELLASEEGQEVAKYITDNFDTDLLIEVLKGLKAEE